MTNPPRHVFLSGKAHPYRARPQALVVLDPGSTGAKGPESSLDVGESDSLRFWVVNNLQVYLFDSKGGDWHRFRTSWQGCLAENRKRKGKRRHLKLKAEAYDLHFSPDALKPKQRQGICDVYKSPVALEDPGPDVPRPYPLAIPVNATEKGKYLNFAEEHLLVVKIAKSKLKTPLTLGGLGYWESVLFRTSPDALVDKWRKNLQNGIPESVKTVKEHLEKLRGKLILKVEHESKPELTGPTLTGDTSLTTAKHLLLNAYSSDAGVVIPEEPQDEKDKKRKKKQEKKKEDEIQNIAQTLEVYGMGEKKTTALGRRLTKSDLGGLLADHMSTLVPALTRDVKNANRYRVKFQHLLRKRYPIVTFETTQDPIVAPTLIKKRLAPLWLNANLEDYHLRHLHVGVGLNDADALADALKNFVYSQQSHVVYKYFDQAREATGKKDKKKKKTVKPKGHYDIALSVKEVLFATSSPNFSEQVVPDHVYFQVKNWWEALSDEQKAELISSVEIEVLGFASALGSKHREFDKWLRGERARNTALALKMVLEQEAKIKRTVETVEVPAGQPFSRYWDPAQATTAKSFLWISYRGAAPGVYPKSSLFNKHEKSFSLHCLSDEVEESGGRDAESNVQGDRSALIMFRRVIPTYEGRIEWDQKVYGTEIVHQIQTVSRITFEAKEKNVPSWTLSLIYACPGKF